MAEENGINIRVNADTKPAEDSLDQFGNKVNSLGKTLGAALAGYLSFQAVKKVLSESVDAAIESDKAVKEFNNSLAVTGQYTQQASQAFQDYASSLQKSTGVADEVILKGASSLVTLGKVAPENLNKASQAALDLASVMQTDASTAFDIMTKAAAGNTRALSTWGIKISEGGSAADRFQEVLSQIEGRFGGLAQRSADPLTKIKVAIDEFLESIGKVATHSKALQAAFIVVGKYIHQLSEKFTRLNTGKTFIDDLVYGFIKTGEAISKYVIAPLETLYRFMVVGIKTIILGLASIVEAAAVAFGKIDLAKGAKEIREKFWNELQTDTQTANNAAVNTAANYVSIFSEKAAEDMRVGGENSGLAFSDGLAKGFNKFGEDIAATEKTIVDHTQNVATAQQEMGIQIGNIWDGITNKTPQLIDSIKSINDGLIKLGQQLKNTFAAGLTNSFAAMGKALVKGENLLDAFAQSMLGVLGDMALQMSTFFMAQAIALMFSVGGAPQGAALMAAAVGLAVVGGVLKALSGGGGGAGGASSATPASAADIGGSNLGGGFSSREERVSPQTGVQVIVQGNILNTRESALEIAQVLNDSFDTNGTFIRATG